jgi:hypothetical protein
MKAWNATCCTIGGDMDIDNVCSVGCNIGHQNWMICGSLRTLLGSLIISLLFPATFAIWCQQSGEVWIQLITSGHCLGECCNYLGHMFFICWFTGPPTWNSGISEKNKNTKTLLWLRKKLQNRTLSNYTTFRIFLNFIFYFFPTIIFLVACPVNQQIINMWP